MENIQKTGRLMLKWIWQKWEWDCGLKSRSSWQAPTTSSWKW
jgi:hypothetical protein